MSIPAVTAQELGVEVGSVFYSSWGYDQTNVDFYAVIGITPSGKSVRLVPIGKRVRGNGVVADSHNQHSPQTARTKRLQRGYNGVPCTAWNSYSSLSLWDGRPKYDTQAMGGAGH